MFQSDELKKHLEESSTIKSQSAIIAEWNMNIPDNIKTIGNYRYRKTGDSLEELRYRTLTSTFDLNDEAYYYTNATGSDVIVSGGRAYNRDLITKIADMETRISSIQKRLAEQINDNIIYPLLILWGKPGKAKIKFISS